MKSLEQNRQLGRIKLFVKLQLSTLLIVASFFAAGAQAADDTYQNDSVVTYPGTVSFPPMIDATNFINNNTFTINYTTISSVSYELFETSDTENYTNNDTMMVNSGFRFSNRSSVSGIRTPSANFYNQGLISCGSIDNINDPYLGIIFINTLFAVYPQCFVSATNIANPGTITVGLGGRIQMTGKNVDLTRTTLNIEGGGAAAGATAVGTGTFGLNTNFWDPSFALTATTAYSPLIQLSALNYVTLYLTNSQAYIKTDNSDPSNVVTRAVFIEDTSPPNVTYNVYLGNSGAVGGNGTATIEWMGAYVDPASGNTVSNYLYLNNNYVLSSTTNVFLVNGIPDNFTFTASDVPITFGYAPTAVGFQNVFPAGSVTNRFAYGNAQLISSSADTNSIPNHSVTNLTSRVEISAEDNLKLANAVITGMNYLSVQSPHQFDGSQGASIQTPYADINIGVTNGFLTVSNLMSSTIPNWSGNVQAWSTRWLQGANGITNEYRVLIVKSKLNPQSSGAVQDLILHGTNSIVISDTFNILRQFTADAKNLTLTTNGYGNGATSLAGELNLGVPNFSWPTALPNLRNLTNDGAIRLQNLTQFVGVSNVVSVVPNSPALSATGYLSEVRTNLNVSSGNQVTIGTNKYVFVTQLTNSIPNQIKIGTKFDASMSNLIAAINRSTGYGVTYSSSTMSNPLVGAGVLSNHAFQVTARVAGVSGNTIVTTNSAATTNLTWGGYVTLHGGAAAVTSSTNVSTITVAYNNLVNHGLISDQGSVVNAEYFESSGIFTNGAGSFNLQSKDSLFTGGSLCAGGDVTIATGNLLVSNVYVRAGRSLALSVSTNGVLTDGGVGNSNVWFVGGAAGVGLSLPYLPAAGDLLGTTITNVAPTNKLVQNVWSARDLGASPAGYVNNQAIGRLILNSYGASPQNGAFVFSGTGVSNAVYVDYLELMGATTNRDINGNLPALQINTNLVIYYAAAVQSGQSVSEKINHKNNDRLRWVPNYAGYYTSTNLVYPAGVTNTLNQSLVNSTIIDSDGDGILNAYDSTPLLVPGQLNFGVTLTNRSPLSVRVQWTTIPNATNYIYYRTNLAVGAWLPFTNFNHYYYGSGTAVTNSIHSNWFASPQAYPGASADVWFFESVTNVPHYYQITVQPWITYPF